MPPIHSFPASALSRRRSFAAAFDEDEDAEEEEDVEEKGGLDLEAASSSASLAVQSGFKLGRNRFKSTRDELQKELQANKTTGTMWGNHPKLREAAVDKIMEWSKGHYPFDKNPGSYKKLFDRALRAVSADMAAARPPEPPLTSKVERRRSGRIDPAPALALEQAEKVRRQALFNAEASDEEQFELNGPRIAVTKVKPFKHKDGPEPYTVTGPGNMLYGGPPVHKYKDMLARMKVATQRNDKQLAQHLLAVLDGGDAKGNENKLVRKFAMIASTSEFFRSAINPVALRAALSEIAADGGDIYEKLLEKVLYIRSDGGSIQSQFHRKTVEGEEYKKTAAAQHDSLMKQAAELGYDPSNIEEAKTFIRRASRSARHGRNIMLGLGAGEAQQSPDAGGSSSPQPIDQELSLKRPAQQSSPSAPPQARDGHDFDLESQPEEPKNKKGKLIKKPRAGRQDGYSELEEEEASESGFSPRRAPRSSPAQLKASKKPKKRERSPTRRHSVERVGLLAEERHSDDGTGGPEGRGKSPLQKFRRQDSPREASPRGASLRLKKKPPKKRK
ncbi:hypothetical protein [uncultured Erythrobacter sp.]|uniref:hypothetical protein n=1 Tax=uncultured Erythrobacter sp. TaxID=263913 RepID=UPI00262AF5B9|nr:hypothetical protein [uncultured Erythrobacter sp.]